MHLSYIRAQARSIRSQTPGIFLLFAGPTLIALFSSFFSVNLSLADYVPNLSLPQTAVFLTVRGFAPRIIQLILSLLFLSASFSLIEVVRRQREAVSFSDINRIFTAGNARSILAAFLVKQLLLLLWNIPSLLGSVLTLFSSYKVRAIYEQIPTGSLLTSSRPEAHQILQYAPILFIGLVLLLAGTALYLPQYYAYSQTDFLLYDRLRTGSYQGIVPLLKESRQLMKGYKWQRFLLDLSFIGWHFLIFLTYGLAGATVYPYITAAQVLFYEQLRRQQQSEKDGTADF